MKISHTFVALLLLAGMPLVTREVANPYLGKEMSTCGTVIEETKS